MAKFTKSPDWLKKADSLPELAGKVGLPAETLVETVDRFNRFSREGHDPDFHRGEGRYQQLWGKKIYPDREPNPPWGQSRHHRSTERRFTRGPSATWAAWWSTRTPR